MIAEWLTYLTTPCPPHLKRMGYLYESIALASRYRRCRDAWRTHITNCQATIRGAMADVEGTGRAVVLGSGLLVELPLADLARQFDEVILIDLIHLREARRRAASYRSIRLEEEDVTGLLKNLSPGQPFPTPNPIGPAVAEDADFVASVGLASQLPLLPAAYVGGTEEDVDRFSAALIQAHVSWLSSLSATTCLITDVERDSIQGDALVERKSAVHDVVLPSLDREWMWDIAPAPEAMADISLRFKVRGGVL